MRKRKWLSLLLSVAMVMAMFPTEAAAEENEPLSEGLCPHHTVHTEDCGYAQAVAGQDCTHEHTEECMSTQTVCVHMHTAECYPDGVLPGEGEEIEPICGHSCTEESGCVTSVPACTHIHDAECGYLAPEAGSACTYICPICPVQALIDALPEADSITGDNAEEVGAKLDEIDAARLPLTDDALDALDFAKYDAAIAALNALAGQAGAEEPVTLQTITSPGNYVISGSKSNETITIDTDGVVNLTFSNLNMTCESTSETKLVVNGGTVNIELDGTNTIQTGQDYQGDPGGCAVYIASGAELHFYDNDNNGSITLHGSSNYWRGGAAVQGGSLFIHGGTVNLVGGDNRVNQYGKSFDGESLTITGGTLNCYAGAISSTAGGNVSVSSGLTVQSGATLTIPTQSTLEIPAGAALTNEGTITNNGSVYVGGALNGSFSGTGSIYYSLTVTGGTASPVTVNNSKTYAKEGETVTLTGTDVPVGQAVAGWTTSDSGVTVENNAFTMPAFALTVTAQYIDAPVLSGFSITQGETPNSYTVKFTSDQAGTWYYTIDRNDTADTADLSGWTSGSCVATENTITLTDQIAGENFHLAVVNQYGLCSTVTDEIENEHTALFNGLLAMFAIPIVNTPIYQHDAPSKEALEALLTERMNEYINSAFDFENRTEEELEALRTLTTQMIVKQYVPAIAAAADTEGVDGSFIFEMEGSLCGWSTAAYLDDSDYGELDPTVIAEPYYTVTLNADGGAVNSGNVTGYVYGVGATLPTDMTHWGYGFDGWYDDETDERVTAINSTDWGNRSFTARWALGGTAPTYTVTIPAAVELGGTATVSVSGVTIVEGSQLVVTLADSQNLKLTTDEGAELSYGITIDSTELSVGSPVLTVAGGTADNSGSATLQFSDPTAAIQYSGDYKGTITFTVSVETVPDP